MGEGGHNRLPIHRIHRLAKTKIHQNTERVRTIHAAMPSAASATDGRTAGQTVSDHRGEQILQGSVAEGGAEGGRPEPDDAHTEPNGADGLERAVAFHQARVDVERDDDERELHAAAAGQSQLQLLATAVQQSEQPKQPAALWQPGQRRTVRAAATSKQLPLSTAFLSGLNEVERDRSGTASSECNQFCSNRIY